MRFHDGPFLVIVFGLKTNELRVTIDRVAVGTALRRNATQWGYDELKKFADGLELLSNVPGTGPYIVPLQPAIHLIQQVATQSDVHQ